MQKMAFPSPVLVRSSVPVLQGMRFQPFVNIDNESFAKPSPNGFWRLNMHVIAHDMQSQLALSAFVTAMSGAAECVVPVAVQWRPNDSSGRMLAPNDQVPSWSFDHVGFSADPFDGFTLHAAANHRDSYIDVNKPALSQLWPGHFITLGDRLHQVVNVSHFNELPNRIRVSVMPNIRGGYPAGEIVVVDDLRLRCRMESGDPVGGSALEVAKFIDLSFIEVF